MLPQAIIAEAPDLRIDLLCFLLFPAHFRQRFVDEPARTAAQADQGSKEFVPTKVAGKQAGQTDQKQPDSPLGGAAGALKGLLGRTK